MAIPRCWQRMRENTSEFSLSYTFGNVQPAGFRKQDCWNQVGLDLQKPFVSIHLLYIYIYCLSEEPLFQLNSNY